MPAVPAPSRMGVSLPATRTSHLNVGCAPSQVKVGDVSRVGPLGPPVIVGAAGIVESILSDQKPVLLPLPAVSMVRTRHSIFLPSGSGSGASAGWRFTL